MAWWPGSALDQIDGHGGIVHRHPQMCRAACGLDQLFEFNGIELRLPTRTFEGRLEVEVGGRLIELIEVGPAHTAGDTLAVVPDARTVYTGDILFIGGTPIVWAGPLSNWVAACDLMLGFFFPGADMIQADVAEAGAP